MAMLAIIRCGLQWGIMCLAVVICAPAAAVGEATGDASATAVSGRPEFPEADKVARLIRSLGDPQYVSRRMAEEQLLAMGMDAFDQIDAATNDPDPEIAANCKYLISELTVRWTRSDDPPWVQRLMEDYASRADAERMRVVNALGGVSSRVEAIGPLCRICRFDPDPAISRQAAVELLQPTEYWPVYASTSRLDAEPARSSADLIGEVPAILRREVGPSIRLAAEWIRLFALQLESADQALPAWNEVIARAEARANKTSDDGTYIAQVESLLRNRARLELRLGQQDRFVQTVEELIERSSSSDTAELQRVFDWAQAAEAPEVTEALIGQFRAQLSKTKSGLYLLAVASDKQGFDQQAGELAEQALEESTDPALGDSPAQRYSIAQDLMGKGYVEWSRRELEATIVEAEPAGETHLEACWTLADSLHDWQLDFQAAEVLTEFADAVRGSAQLQSQFKQTHRQNRQRTLRTLPAFDSYAAYYRACHLRRQGDVQGEWDNLERAYELDSSNADILIAAYRASEGDDTKRELSLQRIDERCRALERQIDEMPGTVQSRNEWAWLVSNTEGDYDKAVRYSLKSIELFYRVPENERTNGAGLIDTLGRCYYAAGQLEKAVEQQRRAVELSPQLRVLRRQLEQFEAALAERG